MVFFFGIFIFTYGENEDPTYKKGRIKIQKLNNTYQLIIINFLPVLSTKSTKKFAIIDVL